MKFGQDLTQGHVTRQLIVFSLPFLLSSLIQALYSMADMIIVGRFSDAAGIAAVANGSMVIFIVNGPITGIITAGTVFIAQYVGAKNTKELKETIGTIFTLFALVAAVIMIGLFTLIDPLLSAINIPAEAFAQTRLYVLICAVACFFLWLLKSAPSCGDGRLTSPPSFIGLTSVVNIRLICFDRRLHMGAVGAGWATMLARSSALYSRLPI